jgi:hypothetical protein
MTAGTGITAAAGELYKSIKLICDGNHWFVLEASAVTAVSFVTGTRCLN